MRKRRSPILAAGIGALFTIAAGVYLGSSGISPADTARALFHKLFGQRPPAGMDPKILSIVWLLRFPRVLLAFLSGGSLAIGGAITQSTLRNPLASPYILGVSSGASLGAGLVIISGFSLPFVRDFTLPVAGFVFGLITVFLVAAFASRMDKNLSGATIILCGMVFSLFVGALLTSLSAIFSDDIKRIVLWQMGTYAMRGWLYVKLILPFSLAGFLGALRYARELDILTFGDEQAKSVGVEAGAARKRLLFFAALLTGAAVSLSGVVGFVDLIAPQVARKIVGSAHRRLIPMAFMLGGSLMVITDLAARTLISPSELPLGALTALIGAPFFFWVYFQKTRGTA